MKEKLKANKGLIIGFAAVIVVAIVILIVANVTKPSYKKQITEFGKACASEEKMEKYVKKYVNLRAIYAMGKCEDEDDMKNNFEKEYKNAKKSDYTNEEFIENTVGTFKMYASGETELEMKDIKKLKNTSEDDGMLGETLSKIKGMKTAECTMSAEGEEVKCYAYFYKGKMLLIMPDLSALMNSFGE